MPDYGYERGIFCYANVPPPQIGAPFPITSSSPPAFPQIGTNQSPVKVEVIEQSSQDDLQQLFPESGSVIGCPSSLDDSGFQSMIFRDGYETEAGQSVMLTPMAGPSHVPDATLPTHVPPEYSAMFEYSAEPFVPFPQLNDPSIPRPPFPLGIFPPGMRPPFPHPVPPYQMEARIEINPGPVPPVPVSPPTQVVPPASPGPMPHNFDPAHDGTSTHPILHKISKYSPELQNFDLLSEADQFKCHI